MVLNLTYNIRKTSNKSKLCRKETKGAPVPMWAEPTAKKKPHSEEQGFEISFPDNHHEGSQSGRRSYFLKATKTLAKGELVMEL